VVRHILSNLPSVRNSADSAALGAKLAAEEARLAKQLGALYAKVPDRLARRGRTLIDAPAARRAGFQGCLQIIGARQQHACCRRLLATAVLARHTCRLRLW
jgi:hypothetical protein